MKDCWFLSELVVEGGFNSTNQSTSHQEPGQHVEELQGKANLTHTHVCAVLVWLFGVFMGGLIVFLLLLLVC